MAIDVLTPPRASLGEGTLWDPKRGLVWWADIRRQTLHAHDVASGRNVAFPLDMRITALALTSDGALIAASDAGRSIDGGQGRGGHDRCGNRLHPQPKDNRFNDGKVDAAGRFWIGTMHDAEKEARGALYRLDRDRRLTRVRTGIMVPNGPAFLLDGTMLFTDTARRTIHAITLDSSGRPIAERVFARFSGDQGYSDEMTVDTENHVWIAFWDGWCLRRLSPDDTIVARLPLQVQRPTCPTFGGVRLDRLYVTTATTGLSVGDLTRQPAAGALFRIDVGVCGIAPHRYTA